MMLSLLFAHHARQSWKCLQMSPVMVAAFSKPETGVPVWLANQLLGKVEVNLRLCPGEPALAKDSAALLVSLVDKHDKAAKLLHSSGLATVVRFLHTAAQCQAARRELAKGVILAATGHEHPDAKREFIKQVVQPFVDRFNAIISREDFKQACHEEQLRLEISDLLELFIGVSRGASASTAQPLFDTLRPVITQLAPLLSVYSNYSHLVELCLEFLSELTKRMLWFLDEASGHTMYQTCLSVMQTYTYDHSGRRSVSQSAAEEDVFRDLLLVMEVLTSLLSKDLVDYNNSAEGTVSAVDVCLLGIRTIMPLMTADLLKFPALCQQYYKMVCFAAEIYPERVSRLPDDQLAFLVSSVQMGLTEFGPDFTMDLILQGQFNADAMDTYRQLVSDILSSYPDATVRERLTSAFNNLTHNLEMLPNRQNTVKFRENFEKFASNVHGFLIVR
ncbi:hypothetical protein B566_EDAN005112 [Ephemera danica]|nr:hypothetical protein B566_EDAN005112 [Ephemera danica]